MTTERLPGTDIGEHGHRLYGFRTMVEWGSCFSITSGQICPTKKGVKRSISSKCHPMFLSVGVDVLHVIKLRVEEADI